MSQVMADLDETRDRYPDADTSGIYPASTDSTESIHPTACTTATVPKKRDSTFYVLLSLVVENGS
jgi:hypothetical protein